MNRSIKVRLESNLDYEAVATITRQAFAASEFGHNGEAELIATIRQSEPSAVSLVACVDGHVAGHIMFSPAKIEAGERSISGMGLAPMAVHPEHQGKGIGSALVEEGIRRLWSDGCEFVMVLGHPEYYQRFGFEPASRWAISHGFTGLPQEVFFIHCRDAEATIGQGRAYYAASFGPQHE